VFRKDFGTMLGFEKDPKSWGGSEMKPWPTRQDMLDRGMSPKSVDLWERIGVMQDGLWKLIEATAKLTDRPVPPRIPGHIPHMFKGGFAVTVRLINDKDPNKIKYHSQYNYRSEREAAPYRDEAIAQVQGKKFTIDGESYTADVEYRPPKLGGNSIATELEALWRASDRMQIPALEKALDGIFESQSMGLVSHALSRDHVTMKGHLFERLNETGSRGLSLKETKEAVRAMERYAEAVVGWHVRAKWAKEVLFPLREAGVLDTRPELRQFTMDSMNAFFKAPAIWTKAVVAPFEKLLLTAKMDPRLASHLSDQISSAISLFYLAGNLPYYIVNINQILLTPMILELNKARLLHETGKEVKVTKALYDHATQSGTEKARLKKIAEDYGYSDPVMVENLIKSDIRDPIAMAIDKLTRETSFNAAYHMAKQVMSERDAIEWAGRMSKEVSVPYGAETGSPLAFGKMGALRPLSTFMTYGQHMLGLHRNQIALMKQGNAKVRATAFNSMASTIALQAMLYGIAGIPFMSNYDQIAYIVAKFFGFDMPSSKEIARNGDVKLEKYIGKELSQNLLTFGLASKYQARLVTAGYLGDFDLSGAGSGAGFTVSTAAARMLGLTWDMALLSGKAVAGLTDPAKAPTKKDIAEVVKQLPTAPKNFAQMTILSKDPFSDILATAVPMYQWKHPLHRPNRTEPTQYGSKRESVVEARTALYGGNPLAQRQGEITEQIIARKEAIIKDQLDNLVQHMKEAPRTEKGYYLKKLEKLVSTTGVDLEATVNAVMKFEMEKGLTPEGRRLLNMSPTLKSMLQQRRRRIEELKQPQNWR
jgi:hypothetical protein